MSSTDANQKPVQDTLEDGAQKKPYVPPIDLNALILRTFLSLYDVTVQHKQTYLGADYVFAVGQQRICMFVDEQEVVTTDEVLEKKHVVGKHVELAKRAFERYEKCLVSIKESDTTEAAFSNTYFSNTYFIALSKLTASHEGVLKEIAHEYGSAFYKKYFPQYYQSETDDSSRANDNNGPILQLFSMNSFRLLLKILPTPTDFSTFLDFHKHILNNKTRYRQETGLASNFLVHPAMFAQALQVQRKLVDTNLLETVESRLVQACEPLELKNPNDNSLDKQEDIAVKGVTGLKVRESLIPKMHKYAKLYHEIIGSSLKNRYKTNELVPISLAKLLISESMYTRLCIMETFMSYPKQSAEDKQEGFERHQHSFSEFGRHYMMVFYGTDAEAYYSRNNIKLNYQDLLLELNAELQYPPMHDIFILGFELIPTDKGSSSNMEVLLDVYHRSGAPLTNSEKVQLERLGL